MKKERVSIIEFNGISCIEKKFSSTDAFRAEYYVYNKMLPITPQLVHSDESELTLRIERIDAETLSNVNNPEFDRLAILIGTLHQSQMKNGKVLCHWDTSLDNYLVADGQYYAIDFEYSILDFPEIDIAHFLAYWSFLYTYKNFSSSATLFAQNYPLRHLLNKNRYESIVEETFLEFDRPKWKFGKAEMESNSDIPKNRLFLKGLFGFST